jgi:adenine-specific DNA methylase
MAEKKKAIETDFPYAELSRVAEAESWRKELNRPLAHIHKWWAQRLGSVFRGIVLAACAEGGEDVWKTFYQQTRFEGITVYDPFMGSGTTLVEARKLGCRVIGRDINPVAYFLVRNAFNDLSLRAVRETFRAIEADAAPTLRQYYQTKLPDGRRAEVLYYFWVKHLPCPQCGSRVDLFDSRVVARHAMPTRNSTGQALCPHCEAIHPVNIRQDRVNCPGCGKQYPLGAGAVHGSRATCPACQHSFVLVELLKKLKHPPDERLYAKMVLLPGGSKAYLPATDFDQVLYREAARELAERENWYPVVRIEPGHNTNQALRYNYTHWHTMFNARQLLSLGHLARRIARIPDEDQRYLFTCLFSSTLEFNNRFCSFKGEGTGAVRHMFAHHVLKPERTPLEANVWGTPRSSGAFSTLFWSRLARALEYRDAPFELAAVEGNGRARGRKVFGLSGPICGSVATDYGSFARQGHPVYLSCGSSAQTDIGEASVDVVITDPPFFDNVHYSELADFFHVWQRHILGTEGPRAADTTRQPDEVQHADASQFAHNLGRVFRECQRVLKADGLMVFTYHHSRPDGWQALLAALHTGDFQIVAVYPIKSEMSVGRPKLQARNPIDIDIIIVCRKRTELGALEQTAPDLLPMAKKRTTEAIARLNATGRRLGTNDALVILMSNLLLPLSRVPLEQAAAFLRENQSAIVAIQEDCWAGQQVKTMKEPTLFDL